VKYVNASEHIFVSPSINKYPVVSLPVFILKKMKKAKKHQV